MSILELVEIRAIEARYWLGFYNKYELEDMSEHEVDCLAGLRRKSASIIKALENAYGRNTTFDLVRTIEDDFEDSIAALESYDSTRTLSDLVDKCKPQKRRNHDTRNGK